MKWTLFVKTWSTELIEDEDEDGRNFCWEKNVDVHVHKIEGESVDVQKQIQEIAEAGEDGIRYEIVALLDEDGTEITSPRREVWLFPNYPDAEIEDLYQKGNLEVVRA